MKNIKKSLVLVLTIALCLVMFTSFTVNGATTYKTDDGSYNYTTVNETTRTLAEGAEIITNEGYTTRSKQNYDQRVTVFTCDVAKNSDIKLATWAIPLEDGTGFVRRDLLTIAQDYERHNPGWVVLGGINADQYFPTLGTAVQTDGSFLYVPQPYYPMITNGDVLFGVSALGYATYSSVVGLKNDGSTKPFVNGTRGTKGYFIHVYNNVNQEIGVFPIDGLNKNISAGQTTVIAAYRNSKETIATVKSSGNYDTYVVSSPELSYVSNNSNWTNITPYATDAYFGKGYISEVTKDVTFKDLKGFAVETDNAELKALLKVGTYIKVEMAFDDEMNGVKEATGYHTVQRKDGKDLNVANSYNSRAYPRSWFGFDATGKAYLMTCFGDNSSPTEGLYAQEMNAFSKAYGITDAWQMDGGGSVTSVVRDENGNLGYAEACIEQSHKEGKLAYSEYRYILSGLFVVMRTPNPVTEVIENNGTDVTFKIDTTIVRNRYDSLQLKVKNSDSSVYQLFDIDFSKDINEINVKGLLTNNNYTYEYISTKNGIEQPGFEQRPFATNKALPIVNSVNAVKNANGYNITIDYSDAEEAMRKLYVTYNGTKYECELDEENKKASATVTGNASLFDIKIEADCVMNKRSIEVTTEELTYKGFAYPTNYCFEKIMLDFEDMLKKFCR